MNCIEIKQLLSEYIDNELDNDRKALVEAHIASCEDCAKEFELLKSYIKSMGSLNEISAPEGFLDEVHERINKKSIIQKLFFPLHIKVPLELMGVMATVLFIFYLFEGRHIPGKVAYRSPVSMQKEVGGKVNAVFDDRKRSAAEWFKEEVTSETEDEISLKSARREESALRGQKPADLKDRSGYAERGYGGIANEVSVEPAKKRHSQEDISRQLIVPAESSILESDKKEEKPIEIALLVRSGGGEFLDEIRETESKTNMSESEPVKNKEKRYKEDMNLGLEKGDLSETEIDAEKGPQCPLPEPDKEKSPESTLTNGQRDDIFEKLKLLIENYGGEITGLPDISKVSSPEYVCAVIPGENYGKFLEAMSRLGEVRQPEPVQVPERRIKIPLRIRVSSDN